MACYYGTGKPDMMTGDDVHAGQSKTSGAAHFGIGMHLLLKMGWQPGQGLGKNRDGPIEPIMPSFKFDTKGLLAPEERVRKYLPVPCSSESGDTKHPVSMLQEHCIKHKLAVPEYQLVSEDGPDHSKAFVMKVIVDGIEYQPSISSASKKQAKALAALVCLQELGLLLK